MLIEASRDGDGEFNSQTIPKYQIRFDSFDVEIISIHARGMTTQDIHDQLHKINAADDCPKPAISTLADNVINDAIKWQKKPHAEIYPLSYLSTSTATVRSAGRIIFKSICRAVRISLYRIKDIFSIWIEQTGRAKLK